MTTHDIDAAAERLIDSYEDGCLFAFGVSGGEWSAWVRPDRAKQMVEIMKVYLAQRARERAEAEERAKPVTVEWLKSECGFYGDDLITHRWITNSFRLYFVDKIRTGVVMYTGGDHHMDTRGQVLDLLRALGVETKKREGE